MPTRKIFADENSEMDIYVNSDNKLFMEIVYQDDTERSGFITLSKEEVQELQVELANYIKEMEANA